MQTPGHSIDCGSPINWAHPLNVGCIGDYSYIPGLSNDNANGASGNVLANSACHDLTILPTGATHKADVTGLGTVTSPHGAHGAGNAYRFNQVPRPGGYGRTLYASSGVYLGYSAGSAPSSFRYQALDRNTPLTFAAWVNPRVSNVAHSLFYIFGTGSFEISLVVTSLVVKAAFYDSTIVNGRDVQTTSGLTAGKWTHVIVTFDGSNTAAGFNFYLNGIKQTSLTTNKDTDPGAIAAFAGYIALGSVNLDGLIDQARIYNRCLSALEAAALYRESYVGSPTIYRRVTLPMSGYSPPKVLPATVQTYTLTGVAAALKVGRVVTATKATYTLTGIDARLKPFKIFATAQTYTLTGIAATFHRTYIVTATTRAYTLTGTPTRLLWGHVLHATTATYVWTGIAATLTKGKKVIAATQTYTVTGIAANLKAARRLPATTVAYAFAASTTNLLHGYKIAAAVRTYALTGIAAGLGKGPTLAADVGSYALNGIDANLLYGSRLVADTQTYALAGVDADLLASRTIPSSAGAFALTGRAAALDVGRAIAAATGSYLVTGLDAGLRATRRLPATTASYGLTGLAALLTRTYTPLVASPGNFALNGIGAALRATKILTASPTSYVLAAPSVSLRAGRAVLGATVAYAFTGVPVRFAAPRLLVTSTGVYTLVGKDVGLAPGNFPAHTLRASLQLLPRLRASLNLTPKVQATIGLQPRLRGSIMLALSPANDYLMYLLGLVDDLDPKNTDGTPKTINNATVTWEIRTQKSPAGSLVASGVGAIVPTGPLAGNGNYYMQLSYTMAALADTDYWYHVEATTVGGFKGTWDGQFHTLARSGQTLTT